MKILSFSRRIYMLQKDDVIFVWVEEYEMMMTWEMFILLYKD